MHACLAEIRRAGSYSSRASRRSNPFSSSPGTKARVSSRFHFGNDALKSGKEVTPGQIDSSGVPRSLVEDRISMFVTIGFGLYAYLKILKISSISESPGNRGFRVHISANIAPTDHISTPVEYCRPPSRISGERYHSVTTCASISLLPDQCISQQYLMCICSQRNTKRSS